MSSQATLSRRAFLGLLRREEQPRPSVKPAPAPTPVASEPGFSLEAFYSSRAQSGEAAGRGLPVFSSREERMTVRVRPQLCLAWQGSFCSTCSERCPIEGAIAVESGHPRVVEANCNGCGLCVQVCPAPLNAFELLPPRPQGPGS
ncbi:MAG TPA: 4Fe-4S dicluster domain-containing protein [Archangium sp.]|nr:4Fe-4S dicluster domain-containing protein [Archangium sp.]